MENTQHLPELDISWAKQHSHLALALAFGLAISSIAGLLAALTCYIVLPFDQQ